MQRRQFLQSAAAAGAGWMLAENLSADQAVPAPASDKLIGMYVHQHWPYRHPYAARTWTYDDWHGYLDGLSRLGFNLVLIWAMQETMPNPLTPSDRANLDKIRRVIDAAHRDFHMKVWISQCPNVAAIDAAAAKVPFEKRHFFYCDRRVNPADAKEMDTMMAQFERVFVPLAQADGVTIIDSDPGSYPNSTNAEFVELLLALSPHVRQAAARPHRTALLVVGRMAGLWEMVRRQGFHLGNRCRVHRGPRGTQATESRALGPGTRLGVRPKTGLGVESHQSELWGDRGRAQLPHDQFRRPGRLQRRPQQGAARHFGQCPDPLPPIAQHLRLCSRPPGDCRSAMGITSSSPRI